MRSIIPADRSSSSRAAASPLSPALGWTYHREERELLDFTETAFQLRADAFPFEIDPRPFFKPRSQGTLNSCCGHALAACLEILYWIRTEGERVRLSPMFAYLAAQKADGLLGRDVGATLCGVIKAAKVFGVCPQRSLRTCDRYCDAIPAPAFAKAAEHRVVSHSMLESYRDVHHFLAAGIGPVLVGIPWAESLCGCNGRIERISGRILGGQALVAVGYVASRVDRAGRPYIILLNSHGPNWGDDGYALVAPGVVDAWARSSAALCIGVSDLRRYRCRSLDWLKPSPRSHKARSTNA